MTNTFNVRYSFIGEQTNKYGTTTDKAMYDVVLTEQDSREYRQMVGERLLKFLEDNRYDSTTVTFKKSY